MTVLTVLPENKDQEVAIRLFLNALHVPYSADEKTVSNVDRKIQEDENGPGEEELNWWDELSTEAKASVNRGLHDAANGNLLAHEDVMQKYRRWL